jgi:hypothetical protein
LTKIAKIHINVNQAILTAKRGEDRVYPNADDLGGSLTIVFSRRKTWRRII